MQKKRIGVLGLILALGLIINGCGNQSQENIKAGFDAIIALEYQTALTHFEKAVEAKENPGSIARGQGIAMLGLTRYEEAAQQFIKALSYSDERVDEFDYDTNYYLATAYFKMGDMDNAEKVYSSILALKEEKDAYFLRGIVALEKGNLEAAQKDFNKALDMDKSDYELRIQVYQELMGKGYTEEAGSYLQSALGNSKKLSEYEKGRLSYYLGDYENARNYLESIKGKKDADTVLLLGQTYEKLGDYNYAASIYSNYLSDHSDDVIICNHLGMCKLQSGDAQAALDYFNRALNMEDKSMTQTLKFNQIVAYEYLGEFDQASVLMKKYLQSYPDDQEAIREYEFLKSR